MILTETEPFIKRYIEDLNNSLKQSQPAAGLTFTQKTWLSFCLTEILMVNTVCWAKFERASLGNYKLPALSWMFRKSKILWDHLLIASVRHTLKKYGIASGVLVLDESDRARSKNTTRIHKACIENKLSVFTVGSLQRRGQMDVLLKSVKSLLQQENPGEKLKEMGQVIKDVFQLMPSAKQGLIIKSATLCRHL